jgi:hypothetical protein
MENWKKEKPEWEGDVRSQSKNKEEFLSDAENLYLRQVAVKGDVTGTGYRLEKELEKVAKKKGYKHIVGEILRASKHKGESRNTNSEKFHERIGYERFGHARYDDRVWGVYEKDISKDKSLEKKVSSIVTIGGLLGSMIFLQSNITGNVISDLSVNASLWVGSILFLIGLTAGFFWVKGR